MQFYDFTCALRHGDIIVYFILGRDAILSTIWAVTGDYQRSLVRRVVLHILELSRVPFYVSFLFDAVLFSAHTQLVASHYSR